MKALPLLLLAASLAANGLLLYRDQATREANTETGAVRRPPSRSTASVTPGSKSAAGGRAAIQLGAAELASLLTGDLKNMVAELEAAGFSPDVIRAILKYRISQQSDARIKALVAEGIPFWLSPFMLSKSEFGESIAALEKEMSDKVTELLGNDYATPAEEALARKEFDYLSPEKQTAAMRLVADFAKRLAESQSAAESSRIGFERREALAKLLSPEEYEQYNLRKASTGTAMRNQLRAFEPSEEEFLAMFRLRRPIDEKYGGNSPPERAQENQALLGATGPIAAALGPERYEEFQLKTTPPYIALYGLTKRLGLPESAITETIGLQTDIQKRAAGINADGSLATQQKQQAIAELTAEAETRLTGLIGPTGAAAYKENGGFTAFMGLRVAAPTPNVIAR